VVGYPVSSLHVTLLVNTQVMRNGGWCKRRVPFGERSKPKDSTDYRPSQAELDFVHRARTGVIRLSDEIFSTTMQWFLQQPLQETELQDSLNPETRQLLRPVTELLKQGEEGKAHQLMEQIGRLDRIERDLRERQRIARQQDDQPVRSTQNPLSRALPPRRLASSLRNAIERYSGTEAVDPWALSSIASYPGPREAVAETPILERFAEIPNLEYTSEDISLPCEHFSLGCECGA